MIPPGTLPRLLLCFVVFATLSSALFLATTATARYLWGNPPERLTWVTPSTPLPPNLVRIGPIKGVSMQPVLHEGETLRCEPYTGQPLLLGDVVIFDRHDGVSVCHRVTAQNATHVYTAGYNNDRSDGWVAKSQITYIVRHVERRSTQPRLVIP